MPGLNMSMNEDQRVTQDLSEILPIVAKYEVQFHKDAMATATQ
jgi:hypothetical protein